MGKIVATVSDEIERKFKKGIIDKKGKLRGEISGALEEAVELWLEKRE